MKFSRSDLAVSAAALLGAAGLLALFAMDMNASSSRLGEKPLGTVIFKRLSATRKAPAGLGWERMRNNGPVYNADTLRTAGYSEASIYFDDGTSLDVYENSMLKLDFGAKTKDLEFLSGQISVGSASAGTSYAISSAAGRIDVGQGAKATFSRDADRLSVEVTSGSASIVRSDGSSQAIAQNQELQVDVKSGEATFVERPILPLEPEPNARLLCLSEGPAGIGFSWELGGGASSGAKSSGDHEYSLEIAASKDFAEPALVVRRSATKASVPIAAASARPGVAPEGRAALSDGTWYWRVRDDAGRESPVRRFSLSSAAAPKPVFPENGASYSYRRIKPDIRFAWTGMDAASAYLFEIAPDSSFSKPALRTRATNTSLNVDELGEGTWYWRAKPIHGFRLVGAEDAAETRRLTIVKSGEMAAPRPSTPLDGSLYQVQDAAGKGLAFAWEPRPEAVSYELLASRSDDLSSPFATSSSSTPYLKLAGADCAALRNPGKYYWGIRWKDREGNLSPASPARALVGVDGSIAIRLSFPPEGYRIADSLVSNTRFAWKTNVPARTVFQVSGDPGFEKTTYQETVSADTLIGRAWPSGRYWWRLRTFNADGSVFLETPARGFEVVDPFPGPSLAKPVPGSVFYLRDEDQATFSWKPIAHADYYKLVLRSAADGYASPILERGLVEGTSLGFPLAERPSGAYRLTLQAFASSGETTTRVIGYLADYDFVYKRVSRIGLLSPAEGERLSGIEARKGMTVFSYELEDRPDEAEVRVSTDPEGKKVVARAQDRSGRAKVGRLSPGVYYWTVAGRLAGYDVSARERVRFEVDKPPAPPPPELVSPAEGAFYKIQDAGESGPDFSWAPEEDAASYELVVSRSKDLSSPIARIPAAGVSARLSGSQAEALKRAGSYYWGVRYVNADGDVSLIGPGRALVGIDADEALRPSFPPEGYRIAEGLAAETRFSWRAATGAATELQVARDPSFKDPARREATAEQSLAGGALKAGRYYWRLCMLNVDGSALVETAPRSFEVVPPLAAPSVIAPARGSSFLLREGDSTVFSWTPVEGADRYKLILRSAQDDYASALVAKEAEGDTRLEYALGDLPGGSYRLSVQGIASPSESRTLIPGRVGEGSFSFKRLARVRLLQPADGASAPGLAVRRAGLTFSFESREALDSAEILVFADRDGKKPWRSANAKGGSASIKGIAPGAYYWTVAGSSSGVDLSARERFRLVVEAPPPLPAPEQSLPAPGTVIGATELRQRRSILLSWKPVAGATHYRLAIYTPGGKEPAFVKDMLASTEYALEDLSVLDRGLCSWTVEARSYDDSGELEQGGLEAKASFTIDIPAVKKARTSGDRKAYGR
jgi:hypothetical protein